MENVVLTVHLILAVALIVLVLLQRSEGGGLGMGGGGGGGVMTGRQAANALSKLTWILATGFLITSMSLTVIAARNSGSDSVIDQLDLSRPAMPQPDSNSNMPALPSYAPPPAAGQPITPPAPTGTAPAAPAPAAPAPTAPAAETPTAPATEAPAAPAASAPAPAPASN